jgi:hypothetical protein
MRFESNGDKDMYLKVYGFEAQYLLGIIVKESQVE